MDLKQLVVVAFQVSLFVIVFGYGLRAEFADLLYLFRRPALLVRSLIAVLVVMPAVAVVLARWFDFTPTGRDRAGGACHLAAAAPVADSRGESRRRRSATALV